MWVNSDATTDLIIAGCDSLELRKYCQMLWAIRCAQSPLYVSNY